MKKFTSHSKTSLYFSAYTRTKIALLISLFLILLSNKASLSVLFKSSRFYVSLCIGFGIAWLVIQVIHFTNVSLDRFFPWSMWKKRLLLQLGVGVCLLVYIDWGLVKLIFNYLGVNFATSGFTEKILPLNAALICLGHATLYLRQRYQLKHRAEIKPKLEIDPKKNVVPVIHAPTETMGNNTTKEYPLSGETNGEAMDIKKSKTARERDSLHYPYWSVIEGSIQNKKYIFPVDEVCCIIVGTVYGDICLKDGKNMNMSFRKKGLRKHLDPQIFIELRSGVFLAYDVIAGIKTEKKENVVLLKAGNRTDLILKPSRRCFEKFKEGFEAYQVNKL